MKGELHHKKRTRLLLIDNSPAHPDVKNLDCISEFYLKRTSVKPNCFSGSVQVRYNRTLQFLLRTDG